MSQEYKVVVDVELKEIMPRYLEIRREELEALEKCLIDNDIEKARMLGHKLKGTGASYGFEELTNIGASIEDIAKAGSLKGIKAQAERLRFILDNLQIEYEEM